MSCSRCLYLSALLASVFVSPAAALNSTMILSDNDFTLKYTHTNTPIPKPASSFADMSRSYKTAGICFLGSGNCDPNVGFGKADDYKIDTDAQCKNEGFSLTSCALPSYRSGDTCPYNSAYFTECKEDTVRACTESGYSVTSCSLPNYLNGQCPYNSAYYNKCQADTIRACQEDGYQASCPTGYVTNTACPYNSSYTTCKCNPCSGYDYTYAQATAQGYLTDGSCNSCGTTKYKRKQNPCDGYSTCECGGASGASSCYSATTQKFSSCKSCNTNTSLAFWCCLPGNCDYSGCFSRVGYSCSNNPSYFRCTDAGGTPQFAGCVGPDYGPFTVGYSAGITPSHNGAQFDCDF